MSQALVAAERISAHCFNLPCRVKRDWDRVLASRPVFKCAGCGQTREFEELGRHGVGPAMAPQRGQSARPPATIVTRTATPRPEAPPKTPEKTHWLTPKRRFAVLESRIIERIPKSQENTMTQTLLQKAIAEGIAEALAPIIEKMKEIEDKLAAAAVTPEKLSAAVDEAFARQLGAPAAGNAKPDHRSTSSASCPRHPHKGKCPSAWCKKAKAKA